MSEISLELSEVIDQFEVAARRDERARTPESHAALSVKWNKLKTVLGTYGEILSACKALIDAPHDDHFVVRLNDAEMDALNRIKVAVAASEGRAS